MTLDAFITTWTNKPVDFDGVYPNQCMDLMHQYVYDVLGISDKATLAQPAAYQVFTNFDNIAGHDKFDKIPNTPTGVPQKGDILFFGQQIGPYGHVCIFIDGDVNSFTSFDANWPTGSLPHRQSHTYNGVLGWLHPKPQANDLQSQLDAMRQQRDDNWNLHLADQKTIADLQAQLSHANDKAGKYDGLQAGLKDLSARFS